MLGRPSQVLSLAFLLLLSGTAHASTLTVDVPTPDPVEERPLDVVASGTLDSPASLFVFIRQGAIDVCGATAADEHGKTGITELTGTRSWEADGEAVASGVYSRSKAYSPATATGYRICAYIASSATAAPLVTATSIVAPRRSTGQISLDLRTANPVEEGPVQIGIFGTSENRRDLHVFVESNAVAQDTCATTAVGESQKSGVTELTGSLFVKADGEGVGPGAFDQQEPFSAPTAGTYRVCAYLHRAADTAAYATATRLLEIARANATLSVSHLSGDIAEEVPFQVVASGTTERTRRLSVFVESAASATTDTCAATATGERQKSNAKLIAAPGGDTVSPEAFSQTHQYVPAFAGLYRLCAYLQKPDDNHVYASATNLVEVRRTTADLTLAASTNRPIKGQPFTVTATGRTERARRLWVYVETGIGPGSVCSATAADERAKSAASALTDHWYGSRISAPRFAHSATFTPTSDGPRLVCAYIQREAGEPPYAAAKLLVGPAPRTFRVRVAKRAGRTYAQPGTSRLTIEGTFGSVVSLTVWRAGAPKRTRQVVIPAGGSKVLTFRWSCRRRGRHHFLATSSGQKAGGSWTVSAKRCRSLRNRQRR